MNTQSVSDLVIPESTLSVQQFPAEETGKTTIQTTPLVLLHGWGCDSRIWEPVLPLLRQHCSVITIDLPGFGHNAQVQPTDLSLLIEQLAAVCPPQFVLAGWSLGGMVATAMAVALPERVAALITIGSNLKFVASDDWPAAMSPEDFAAFYSAFKRNPALGLKRFVSLEVQGGDAQPRDALKLLREQSSQAFAAADAAHWVQALEWLADWDLREQFVALTVPGLHVYAEDDTLVPVAVAKQLPFNPNQQTVQLPDASHSFFCSNPASLLDVLAPFLRLHQEPTDAEKSLQRNKQKVAASFSRAAEDYDAVAYFQRDVGEHLLKSYPLVYERLDPADTVFRVLDLGCGTGYFSAQLADLVVSQSQALRAPVPSVEVFGCDIAEGMIRHARAAHPGIKGWITGDAESLPLADNSVDSVFSSMALQWCENPGALLNEIYRVLRPGSCAVFSTLGPSSLFELRDAWQAVDGFVHVNQFVSAQRWQALVAQSNLQLAGWTEKRYTLTYQTAFDLMRELKTLGAHNVNDGQSKGLTGRQRLLALQRAYEDFRCDGLLPATYEVYFVRLSKPKP